MSKVGDNVEKEGGEQEEDERIFKKTVIFKCEMCPETFKRRDHWVRHVKTLHEQRPEALIKCPVDACTKKMSRLDHMRRHIYRVHRLDPTELLSNRRKRKSDVKKPLGFQPAKRFQCMYGDCEVEVSRREHLRRHIRMVHKKDPREVMGEEAYASTPAKKKKTDRRSSERNKSAGSTSTEHSDGKSRCSRRPAVVKYSDDDNVQGVDDHDYVLPSDGSYFDFMEEPEEEEEDGNAVLCMLCSYTFYSEDLTTPKEDLSESLEFNKFISEVFEPSASKDKSCHPTVLLNSLQRLSVCTECLQLTNSAMAKKFIVDDLELTVRKLHLKLQRKLKDLQQKLADYSDEMKNISEVVSGADVGALKGFLERNTKEGRKEDNLVVLLRKGVVAATTKLQMHKSQVQNYVTNVSKSLEISLSSMPTVSSHSETYSPKKKPENSEELVEDVEDVDMDEDTECKPENADADDLDSHSVQDNDEHDDAEASKNSVVAVESEAEQDCPEDKGAEKKKRKKKKAEKQEKKSKANNKVPYSDIDTSGWSEFKVTVLQKVGKMKTACAAPSKQLKRFPDPRQDYLLEYNREDDTFTVGQIPVLLDEQEKSLKCSKCDYSVVEGQRSMQKHVQLKHLSIFKCPICPGVKSFANYKRYFHHLTGHTGEIKCDKCDRSFVSDKSLRAHTWYKHMTPEEIEEALQQGEKDPRSKKRDSASVKKLQCSVCGAHVINLEIHMQVHEDREPQLCGVCGSTFASVASLLHHQTYSCFPPGKEPPRSECDQCRRSFKSKHLLARHVKDTHSQQALERAFKCEVCGSGFTSNHHLKRHLETHSVDRPYVCRKGCGADFEKKKLRRTHEQLCSGDEPPGKVVSRKRKIDWDRKEDKEESDQ